MHSNKLGLEGERAAQKYMLKNGYKIIECNYDCKIGEVDIICCKDKLLIFVEVKSRTSAKFSRPADAVTRAKQLKYITIAKYYIAAKKLFDYSVRFDVIEYIGGEVNHLINAFN